MVSRSTRRYFFLNPGVSKLVLRYLIITAAQLEAASPDEIGEAQLLEEFHPQQEVKKSFQRPKRPGRR